MSQINNNDFESLMSKLICMNTNSITLSKKKKKSAVKTGFCVECGKQTTKQYPLPNCGAFYCSDFCWSK